MPELSKKQRKHLRQLAGQSYEKEMSLALASLYEDFKKWEGSEISAWDLNDRIHKHHNETARELWKIYELMNDPALAVSVALARGILQMEDIPEDCRELLAGTEAVRQLMDH